MGRRIVVVVLALLVAGAVIGFAALAAWLGFLILTPWPSAPDAP